MTSKKYNKSGGKALASGGYGCVFKDALKCRGKQREQNKITKLMTKKHATQEYEEIQKIKKILEKIPNYTKYFLVNDFTICVPDILDESDLENYEKKCTALPKDGITRETINQSLEKLLALNMPFGGIPVDDYIFHDGSFEKLIPLNNSLINLLTHGIVPMNNHHTYHCDVKDSNVLVAGDKNNIDTRLIDWGLSIIYHPDNTIKKIPRSWMNRPLQFNSPFSIIIFTDLFASQYDNFLKNGGKLTYIGLKPFVLEYIYIWTKKRGLGHYKFINSLMYMFFSNEMKYIDEKTRIRMIETDFTLIMITNYIIEIILNFTKFGDNDTIKFREYLDTVFIKIVDIWGFIMIYCPIIEILFKNYDKLTKNQMNIFSHLKHIFLVYCFNPRTTPIDITSLTKDLKHLNTLFENESNASVNGKYTVNSLNNNFQRNSLSIRPFSSPTSSTKSYFIKTTSTAKKLKYLLLASNKSKNNKTIKKAKIFNNQ
jgi:hypothetical protein